MTKTNETHPGVGSEQGTCKCCLKYTYITKHHVVPYAFSRHFDSDVYQNNFIDLCRDCHDIVEIELHKFRRYFRGRLGITQDDLRQSDEHIRYKKAKAYAWQLVSNHANIPTQKVMEMTLYIHLLYPDVNTYEDFKRIAKDDSKINETRTDPYGKVVSDKIKELGLEEWFGGVWKRKNRRVIRKLQKKGVEHEKSRKKRLEHKAPESTRDGVIEMLIINDGLSEEDAREVYNSHDADTKLSLRRCAYAWKARRQKRLGVVDEASKEDTGEYIATRHNVTIETATEMFRLASKSKKRKWRKQAYFSLEKKADTANE